MPSPPTAINAKTQAYLVTMDKLLAPLVRLLIAKGVTHPMLDELMQRHYVAAAERWFVGEGERATASRLYMLTGIHRKKIAPLREADDDAPAAKPSVLQLVLDEWSSNPAFLNGRGARRKLALSRREGGERSFEALVEGVSKDIRPRAVMDRLLDAGIARLDDKGLLQIEFGPEQMRINPDGDHVAVDRLLRPATEAVTATVLRTRQRSAVFAIQVLGLSEAAALELTTEVRREIVEVLERFNERAERRARDEKKKRGPGPCTVYVGSYEWTDGLPPTPAAPAADEGAAAPAKKAGAARRKRPAP
jgi:hypothetical protein